MELTNKYEELTCNLQETIKKINEILKCNHKWGGEVILTNPGIITCIHCGVHAHDDDKYDLFVDDCVIKSNNHDDSGVTLHTVKAQSRKLNVKWSMAPPQDWHWGRYIGSCVWRKIGNTMYGMDCVEELSRLIEEEIENSRND